MCVTSAGAEEDGRASGCVGLPHGTGDTLDGVPRDVVIHLGRFQQLLPARLSTGVSREDPGTSSGTWDRLGQDKVPELEADRLKG